MKDNATLLAVGGVIAITIATIASSVITGQTLDSETVKMAMSGLIGFASGAAVTTQVVK